MNKIYLALLMTLTATGSMQAVEVVALGQVQYQKTVSVRIAVTESTVEAQTEAAFERIETILDIVGAEYPGHTYSRALSDLEVEPYTLEVGYLVGEYPVGLPRSYYGSLPAGPALYVNLEGRLIDVTSAYEAIEQTMETYRMASSHRPWEIYSPEDEQWIRVVWPVGYAGSPAPLPPVRFIPGGYPFSVPVPIRVPFPYPYPAP